MTQPINPTDFSHFESQFNDGRLSDEMDNVLFEKICDLRDRISDLSETLEWRKSFLKFTQAELDDLERIRKSLEQTLREVRNRIGRINDEQRAFKQEIRPDERRLEDAQREWIRLMAELEAQRKLRGERAEIDALTINAPWRVGIDGKRALPHQFEGAYRLSSARRAILGDEMGLGKTLQSIMTVDMLRNLGQARKILVVCPKPILDGFRREFLKWSPNQFVHVLNQTGKGVKSEILDLVAVMEDCTILTNYEVWRKDKTILQKLINCQFDTVILDECHNLKDSKSATFKGIKEIVHAENKCTTCDSLTFGSGCPVCGSYPEELFDFRSVKNVFPMTGTLLLNKPEDAFAVLHLIDDQGFPDLNSFLRDFCQKICLNCRKAYNCVCVDGPKWGYTFRSGGEADLLSRLGSKYTARTRESAGVKMPPQEVIHHSFELDKAEYPRQYEFTQLLKNQARLKFGDDKEITLLETLAWYTRMRQSATWPDGIKIKGCDHTPTCELDEDGKSTCYNPTVIFPRPTDPPIGESIIMDKGEAIVREALDSGHRIVVFSHFKEALKELERRLNADGIPLVRYDGDLNERGRLDAQLDFDLTVTRPKDAKYKVMLAQYKSAKVGLNLHGAQQILFLDREWNPGMEKQAMQRNMRIGSEFDTIVHILHCEGTATELMDAIMDTKTLMTDSFEQASLSEAMKKFLGDK